MAAAMLETPSRVWRRIQEVEGQDMPSLPSLPVFEDSVDQGSTASESMDLSDASNPLTSTPATFKSSNTMATIRPPGSAGSTARFAQSINSRSSKSSVGLSASRASTVYQSILASKRDDSFDVSMIPSIPHNQLEDMEIRSSDQESRSKDDSLPDDYLPPISVDADHDVDVDLSDALRPISRSNSPGPDLPGMTPKSRKYDYSISLKSEPQPSPMERLRNVSIRRPLSRNTRTPSLTRTESPSPTSSLSSQPTPQSMRSKRQSPPSHAPSPAHIPLPRSNTASPMPLANTLNTPASARGVPLPRSRTNSPTTAPDERDQTIYTVASETEDEAPMSLPPPPSISEHDELTMGTDIHTEDTHSEAGTHEDREPTFSSEDMTQTSRGGLDTMNLHYRSITPGFGSPAQSSMMTPTPAFQPRPRARFNTNPVQGSQHSTTPPDPPGYTRQSARSNEQDDNTWRADTQAEAHEQGIPVTPGTTHKRSFLLSVINSTARPRMKISTPHPRAGSEVPATPASEEDESDTTISGANANVRTTFAGVTPRPRAVTRSRLSHPLAQAWTAPVQEPQSAIRIESGTQSPGLLDGAVDRASFISTTSSQDLTTHARANASFDPVIGLGERGHGINRFNANKLNNYLHGLNRKLQEENEVIMARLREYEERYGGDTNESGASSSGESHAADQKVANAQRKSSGRRVSAGPTGLGDVAEDAAEDWVEEKAAMEEQIEQLQDELARATREKDAALVAKIDTENDLEDERGERGKAKEKYASRIANLEEKARAVVDELDVKLQEAERRAATAEKDKIQTVKQVERRLAEVVIERDLLAERMEKAENALASGRELGSEVNAANERVGNVLGDLRNANIQIRELEEERSRQDDQIEDLEQALHEQKAQVSELEQALQVKSVELEQTSARINVLEGDFKNAKTTAESYKVQLEQNEKDAEAAVEHIESLMKQLTSKQNQLEATATILDEERDRANRVEIEAKRASELTKQVEEALDAAEMKMRADEEEVISLKAKIASLERELDRSRSRSLSHLAPDAEAQEQIDALEAELDEANKEIARLNVRISQSPARKAMEKAKDAKIDLLEQEKEDLLERIKSLRRDSLPFSTPAKSSNTSTLTPMHRHILSMTMRTPKTPGGPLRDLSWLQNTINDPTMTPLITEIERLQHELERANVAIDDKLDRLEDAGVDVITVAVQLEDAKSKIVVLEEEIGRMTRTEERRSRRLERLRCQKCLIKIDTRIVEQKLLADESSILSETSMALEPPTPPTRTSEKLRADLEAVNTQLASMKRQWDQEKRQLLGDKAVLQDATTRLNAEVRQAKNEIQRYAESERASEKAKANMEGELGKAKRMVEELEHALTTERSRLRSLSTGQAGVERQKDEVAFQLKRTEADMADIREELQRIKQENRDLETELRSNATIDQKARLLEAKVSENSETIEQLRKERSLLVTDHKDLQRQFLQITEHVNKLREEHATSQASHDHRRHELDMKLLEIEDLRRALSEREDDLERVEAEKQRAANERGDVDRNVAALEADLRRVKREAEAFGRDLKALRVQKERLEAERTKAERGQKQCQTEIRLLRDEAREQKDKALVLQKRWSDHVCAADNQQLSVLRSQHKDECKGLIVQIRYLKAKYTRESTMRSDLCNQKRYLIVLLARCERNEQKILAAIAQVGFPAAPEPTLPVAKRRKTLRSVVHCVVFLARAKRASDAWREQAAAKDAIAVAYQEVRKRRQSAKDGT